MYSYNVRGVVLLVVGVLGCVCVGGVISTKQNISIASHNIFGNTNPVLKPVVDEKSSTTLKPVIHSRTKPAPGYGVKLGSDGLYYWVDLKDKGYAMYGCDDINDSIKTTWSLYKQGQVTFTEVVFKE